MSGVKSDIEIARTAKMKPIGEVLRKISVPDNPVSFSQLGRHIAKLNLDYIDKLQEKKSNLILVTAITPTPAGEGKTTTSVGLCDGLNKIGKQISNNTGFLIRLDDIAENMKWEFMEKIEILLDKFDIKPVLGVIPNNKDPELLSYPKKNANFWDQVRVWKGKGWEIGMHGTNHLYNRFCSKNDYLGHGGNTEFCDHSYHSQLEKIRAGLNKFKEENALLTQSWVMEPKKKVKDILKELSINDLKIKDFYRLKIGE